MKSYIMAKNARELVAKTFFLKSLQVFTLCAKGKHFAKQVKCS